MLLRHQNTAEIKGVSKALYEQFQPAQSRADRSSGTISRMATANLKLAAHLPQKSLLAVTTTLTQICRVKNPLCQSKLS